MADDPFTPISPSSTTLSLPPSSLPPPSTPSPFLDDIPYSSPSHSPRKQLGSSSNSSSSGIGNRSLMGLLGGTRLDGWGFDGLGVGPDLREEEEEEEEEGGEGKPMLSGGEAKGKGRSLFQPPSTSNYQQRRPRHPTSHSTSSSRSHNLSHGTPFNQEDDDDEEEEEDEPPDFTTRIPLSTSHARRSSTSSASSAALPSGLHLGGRKGPKGGILNGMKAKERALWRWVNTEDLDAFLQEVYLYYVGKGIWAIGLSRLLNLLTVGWVIMFSTFLGGCIDYSILWQSHSLQEVVVPKCFSRFSGLTLVLVLIFSSFYFWRVVSFGLGVKKLWSMHEFYAELLEVPENDIQTIPWHALVTRLSALRATHPSSLSSRSSSTPTTALDAHDVANRIMREENYLIALFNKDVLDLSIPVPTVYLKMKNEGLIPDWLARGGGEGMLTRTLEWNLAFCLIGFLFDESGQVRKKFLGERNKGELSAQLRNRFLLMGLINAVFAPFIVLYLLMYSFFRYFEEYHKNPSSIGSRQFTPLARWQFREFNELPHLFLQRLNRAHPLSEAYVAQFPKEKTALISRFVAFLAGSFAAVLILFSIIDPDAFLHFEITKGRTVLFYIGVFGTVLAAARGMVPDENRVVDPEELMKGIVEHTHFCPAEWRGKLHSAEVHTEFGQMFQMKISLFVQELLSVIITPFVLWYTLPPCAGAIVDFFREFTVHVDGLGYVCSFAVFDFKRHGDARFGAPVENGPEPQNDRWKSKEGKMEKSFLNFTSHNPNWQPRDQTQSLYLSRMTDASVNLHPPLNAHVTSPLLHPHTRFTAPTRTRSNPNRFQGPTATVITTGIENVVAEKAKLYDQAFQKSTMGTSLAGGKVSGGRRVVGLVREEENEVIDESSGLDGDNYVATTEQNPFGQLDMGEEFGDNVVVEGKRKEGISGLVREMYDGSSRRGW